MQIISPYSQAQTEALDTVVQLALDGRWPYSVLRDVLALLGLPHA